MSSEPDFAAPKVFLIVALPEIARQLLDDIISKFAATGQVIVLDAGNCFNSYRIAHLVRQKHLDHRPTLANIQVARAFTCQQLMALLEKTPIDSAPKVILNLLSTFSDDGIDIAERNHAFSQSLERIRRLGQVAQVFISVCPPSEDQMFEQEWFSTLQEAAGNILFLKGQPVLPLPEGLF